MKESALKTFWRDTYKGQSPVPFIISVQVGLFVLIHIFDLLQEIGITQLSLYSITVEKLSLPLSFHTFITQPWSLATYSFLYTNIFQLLFDCLWLFWIGSMFMNFLNRRQFLFVYSSAIVGGGLLYLGIGTIPGFGSLISPIYTSASFALGAMFAALATLVPRSEVRLLLIGNISLKTLAIAYIVLAAIFIAMANKPAAISFLLAACWGFAYTKALQNGNDYSLLFNLKKRSKLKIVHKSKSGVSSYAYRHQSDLPNQDEVDEILDKISVGGYESLTSQEKEVLFKASKGER
ncbi:rhomboid family intramembrane serine protease [Sphingobacterium oryzagri]|uniref:Rhomboid family intramembrane serine protease n=1 Tax=Sphingobacterium oryzagri TaxID=3025669 RepID=A0ABY7WFM0_9SPHI|nr:rhomboid family intramembrane serine protease [Sphingobacterium sp. KACC 22765]WDF68422.1 rhomboid family intramembrane serine protease [Sphingobacterium sp. KACC 22765]